jgi:mRNA-decapping enzyme subunit 2
LLSFVPIFKMSEHCIPEQILDNLYSRFVSTLPRDERGDDIRVMFHLQEAYWFYIDFVRPVQEPSAVLANHTEKEFPFDRFVRAIAPRLEWHEGKVGKKLKAFWHYSNTVPRCGGLLLNNQKTKILLVRSYYGKKWGFPVGKINHREPLKACAEREVFEETGFHGQASEDKLQYQKRKAQHHLYLFYNVPEHYNFTPQTRKEISEIKWVPLGELSQKVHVKPFWSQLSRILGLTSLCATETPTPSSSSESSPSSPAADLTDNAELPPWEPFEPLPPQLRRSTLLAPRWMSQSRLS